MKQHFVVKLLLSMSLSTFMILIIPSVSTAEVTLKMRECDSVKILAEAASEVYSVWDKFQSSKKFRKKTFGKLKLLKHFYGGKKYGGIASLFEYKSQCILSWKGTDVSDVRDVKADIFSLAGKDCKGFGAQGKSKKVGNCGLGFSNMHNAILSKGVYAELQKHLKTTCKGKRLLITGHSLGGALASLFSSTLSVSNPTLSKNSLTVTFGAPRVFGYEDADRYHRTLKDRVIRVISYGDAITTLPRAKLSRARHFGDAIYLTTAGKLFKKKPTYQIKDQDFSAYWKPGSTMTNHKMKNYIKRVNRCTPLGSKVTQASVREKCRSKNKIKIYDGNGRLWLIANKGKNYKEDRAIKVNTGKKITWYCGGGNKESTSVPAYSNRLSIRYKKDGTIWFDWKSDPSIMNNKSYLKCGDNKGCQITKYQRSKNKYISGKNMLSYPLKNMGINDCARDCDTRESCNSFDYKKTTRECFPQKVYKGQSGIKMSTSNKYDHYVKRELK